MLKDFVVETSTTIGTGTLQLAGPPDAAYRSFVSAYTSGVVFYCIRNSAHNKWEIGYGTLTDATPDTLTRNLIDSHTGSLVSWTADDAPLEVYTAPLNFLIASLLKTNRSTARPAWLPAYGIWIGDGTGAGARTINYFDGTNDIVFAYLNETDNAIEFDDPTRAKHAANKRYVDNVSIGAPGARLSLTTAVPVTSADVTAGTTLFLVPYKHNLTKIWDGTQDVIFVRNEISLGLNSNSGHTGYHQSGKAFDVFEYARAGAAVLGTSPAWTNDTTRGFSLARRNGRLVNAASIVLRYGTLSGDTETVAADLANYVGTFYCTANGQTEDSLVKRFLWNMYNRVLRPMRVIDTTDTWTYTLGTIRQARASTANQLDFIRGLDEDPVWAIVLSRMNNDSASQAGFVQIGLDSTTAAVAGCLMTGGAGAVGTTLPLTAHWSGLPGLGRHFLAWLENTSGIGTTTFTGDGATTHVQSGLHAGVFA